jgi:hypothetical protein
VDLQKDDEELITCLCGQKMPQIDMPTTIPQPPFDESLRQHAIQFDFNDEPNSSNDSINEDEFQNLSPKTEKLLWHYRLGHTPFSVINKMAKSGELPARLANACDPVCSSCMYGTSTRRPWRTKLPATSDPYWRKESDNTTR